MNIVIVGTFPPFRGGIANFYHTMAEKLSVNHQVTALNFTTQYPNSLFPGKSQFSESQKKAKYSTVRLLSSTNPLSWKKTAKRIIELQPDLIIFKYWMPFFAPAFGSVLKKVKRKLQIKALVVCDNILPHESRLLDESLTKYFLNNVDFFMVMSKAVEKELLSFYPHADYVYTPHPLFDLFGEKIPKKEAKSLIEINEENMILFFGLIREYKGLDLLIKAAGKLKEKIGRFKILAVGDCYEDQEKYIKLIKDNEVEEIIDLRMEFIPNDQVYKYFSAADAIVLPYKTATQSGIVPVAYHFNKPVIITDVGGLKEIVIDGQTGLVVNPNPNDIAVGILKFYRIQNSTDFDSHIQEFKQQFSWRVFIEKLETLYQS
ncbi:MAG: glycosyltransferase [Fidelibacterota bacterium]